MDLFRKIVKMRSKCLLVVFCMYSYFNCVYIVMFVRNNRTCRLELGSNNTRRYPSCRNITVYNATTSTDEIITTKIKPCRSIYHLCYSLSRVSVSVSFLCPVTCSLVANCFHALFTIKFCYLLNPFFIVLGI